MIGLIDVFNVSRLYKKTQCETTTSHVLSSIIMDLPTRYRQSSPNGTVVFWSTWTLFYDIILVLET